MRPTWAVGLFLAGIVAVSSPAAEGVSAGEEVRLRLRVQADAEGRDRLSSEGFDISGYGLREGWVEVITDPSGAIALRKAGFSLEVLERRDGPRPLGGEPGTDVPLPDTKYADPGEIEAFLQQVAADHPDITRLVDLGSTHQGRSIFALMISDNAEQDEDELTILFNGQHHAREVMTPEIVMDTIDYLTDGYGVDPAVTDRVDRYQIWCVPSVNPDGNARVHEVDDFWRKNTRDNDGNGTIGSGDGVDLNRNYEWGWGYQCLGSSGSTTSETYRGPFEGSEPEARALAALGDRIRPVFDVEYHSYGEDVFYALSCDPVFSPKLTTIAGPNQDIGRVIAEDYASRIVQADGGVGYSAAPYGSRVDGTGRDHQYHDSGAISFVTEVNSSGEGGFHPDYDTWRDATVEGHRPAWLWLIDRMAGPAVGGHVRDATNGAPLDADVSLDELLLPDGKRLTSRGDTGRFHVIVVPGAYTLRVRRPGYEDAVVPVTVGSAWEPVSVELQPTGSMLLASDDLEDPATPSLWTVGGATDTANRGIWEWAAPHGTHAGDVIFGLTIGAPGFDRTPGEGSRAFVTGDVLSSSITLDEVSGGVTTLTSPSYDLSGTYGVRIHWHRWFRNDSADPGDRMVTEVSADGGTNWIEVDALTASTSTADASPAWAPASILLDEFVAPGPDVRIRFRVNDDSTDHVVEGAVDDLEIRGFAEATQGQVDGVRLDGAAATRLEWEPVGGAAGAVYDVARGDLASLAGGAGGVDLGPLVCVEDDSVDRSTAGDEDSETPEPGEGFFYLVRFQLGFSTGEWGRGSEKGVRNGSGGCLP